MTDDENEVSLDVNTARLVLSSYLPEKQSERSGASRPATSCLGVGGRGRGDGAARGGGQQQLSGDGTRGVRGLNRDQCNRAVVTNTCRQTHAQLATRKTCRVLYAFAISLSGWRFLFTCSI